MAGSAYNRLGLFGNNKTKLPRQHQHAVAHRTHTHQIQPKPNRPAVHSSTQEHHVHQQRTATEQQLQTVEQTNGTTLTLQKRNRSKAAQNAYFNTMRQIARLLDNAQFKTV